MSQFIQTRLLASLLDGLSPARQKCRIGLLIAAVTFAFLAMARPQWGFTWEEAKQQGLDIVIAIDTSRSMLAKDVAPNRLTRAKLAALDLMKQAKNDRLGLVSFAGTAFLQSPLTLDEEAFRQSLDVLDVGIIPEGGTDLASAIDTSLTAFEKENDNHKILVLFTDGEDHDTDTETLAAAEKAAKAGMKIFTIGVGTAEGEILRIKDEHGNESFLKDDEGRAIKSHLNETLLQKIASTTAGGFYLPLKGPNPMEVLYERGLKPLPKSDSDTKLTKVYRERYHWPLALALICLIAEMLLPDRKRAQRTETPKAKLNTAAVTLALLLFPLTGISSPSGALRDYNSGEFSKALDEYERLSERKTNDYRLQYNAGTAAYQAKQLEAAKKHLEAAINSPEITPDLATQQRAYYNLGNTEFQLGDPMSDPDKKKEMWEQSIENYNHALRLDPKDTNANNNLSFVKRKLEELKKQQQQQQQNKDSKDNKDNKDQNQQDQQNQKDKKDQNKDQKDQKDQKSDNQQQKNAQDQKSDQQKQDQQKKQAQEEKKKQEQAKKEQEKKDQEKQAAAQEQKDPSQEKAEEQQAVAAGKMTQQEAKRILDSQQEDEKALIFRPESDPQKLQDRKIKDW